MFNPAAGWKSTGIYKRMKTRIFATLLSLFAAFALTSCLGSVETGSSTDNNGGGSTPTLYELTVNKTTWQVYPSKVTLTDNAKEDPKNYTSDYTLTIIAVDASNEIKKDSKRLTINFNADEIAELKDTNIAEQEGFSISYRAADEIKAVEYKPTEGVFTVSEVAEKSVTFVFNQLKLEGESNNILLPGESTLTLSVQGEVKCAL